MKLLAIDPASYKLGIALFREGELQAASTIEAGKNDKRLARMAHMIDKIAEVINFFKPDVIVVEDPLLKGRNNAIMERLKGIIEATAEIILGWEQGRHIQDFIHYIPPTTVKRLMGSGTLDKLEVAMAAGDLINTEGGKEIMAELIEREEWDATDAVAIGLSYYIQHKPEEVK